MCTLYGHNVYNIITLLRQLDRQCIHFHGSDVRVGFVSRTHSGRTLVFDRHIFPVLRSTYVQLTNDHVWVNYPL